MGETKIMASGLNMNLLKKSGKNSCSVCQTGVRKNAVFCGGCLSWIHKKCNGIKGSLRRDPDFSCAGCLGKVRPLDGRLVMEVLVDDKKLKLYKSSVIWETSFLLAEVVNWLQSRTANRLRAGSASYSLSTPMAICHV